MEPLLYLNPTTGRKINVNALNSCRVLQVSRITTSKFLQQTLDGRRDSLKEHREPPPPKALRFPSQMKVLKY